MIQQDVIVEFLNELFEKLPIGSDVAIDCAEEGELIRFVQDWLKSTRGSYERTD